MAKPSLIDIRCAIDRSGYVLELRLAPKVEKAGFWVSGDKQFQDQDSGKSREIDLYATYRADIAIQDVTIGGVTYVVPDTLQVHLVLECKALSTPLVFFARENKLAAYGRLMFGGFPSLIWKRDRRSNEIVGELYEFHMHLQSFHSYWTPRYLATRFGRLTSKKAGGGVLDWDLEHGGIYPAIEKLCKASISVHRKHVADSREHDPEHTNQFSLHTTYPVLVTSAEIYECRVSERGYSLKRANTVYLDWSLDSEQVKGSTRICVVSERAFGTFLKRIVADRLGIERALHRIHKKVRQAATYEKKDPGLRKHHSDDA